ncbi:MAG: class I SAM-dependent methyltransferase [Bacteroidetes bacterium]|nr:class I SAM-dependent methyltransferase [Bacteroidota bacterium]
MSNDPRWGTKDRAKKGHAILQTISDVTDLTLSNTQWLDIGCGNGGIATTIAPHVASIVGVDPVSWAQWAESSDLYANLQLLNESIESLSCSENSCENN